MESLSREHGFIERHFKPIPKENGLFDWDAFHKEIHADPNSTVKCKKFEDILLLVASEGVYEDQVLLEWHHLTPLCMHGAIESGANYSWLTPILHIKAHAALCYFFPSYTPLHIALSFLVSAQVQPDAVIKLLEDEDMLAKNASARENAMTAICVPNHMARKPLSDDPKVNV